MGRTLAEYKAEIAERRAEILTIFRTHYGNQDTSRIEKAMDYAELLHRGQLRRSGVPYIFHPLAVTRLVAEAQLDENCLIAALLHDTIEDTVASKQVIADKFGPYISDIVHALTKIRSYSSERAEEDKRQTYQRILKAASKDVRPLLIKIFDRLNNMRDMTHMPEGHRQRISRETLDVYVPLTRRLGMRRVERDLTSLSLRFLFAEAYERIEQRIEKEVKEREDELYESVDTITRLCQEQGIDVEIVTAWPTVADFYDTELGMQPHADVVIHYNLIINNILNIYTALGVLHSAFTPVPKQVRDMIASPMANGYRALETRAVNGGRMYRLSVMTAEMYDVNDHGIIHNWRVNQNRLSGYYTGYMNLLGEILEDENVRVDEVLQQSDVEGVAVFSPQKDLYMLPKGAIALDFAYAVHREVGAHAKAAIVNGVERSILQRLRSGDVIRVVTDEQVVPDESWLEHVASSKARSSIKNWLRRQLDQRAMELGRDMFSEELVKYGFDPKIVVEGHDFSRVLKNSGLKLNELYRRVGYRQILAADFIAEHDIVPKKRIASQTNAERASIKEKIFSSLRSVKGPTLKFSKNDVFIKYAHCCTPIFGDKVVGVVSAGKGVTVHRYSCPNLKNLDKGRLVEVEWDSAEENLTSALLNLHIKDKRGVMAKILLAVNKYGINLSEFNAYTVGHEAFMKLRLDVSNQRELLRVVNEIRKIEAVDAITREE